MPLITNPTQIIVFVVGIIVLLWTIQDTNIRQAVIGVLAGALMIATAIFMVVTNTTNLLPSVSLTVHPDLLRAWIGL